MDSGAAPQTLGNADVERAVAATTAPTPLHIAGTIATEQRANKPMDVWESTVRVGLKFKLRKMSRMALVEAQERLKEPKVPTVYIKDDDRYDPNPNDPDYVDALRDYIYNRNVLIICTCVALGTDLLEVGLDTDKPTDTDWIDQLAVTGFEPPANKWAKYVSWVRLYALDAEEIVELINSVQRFNGFTREADVETAVDTFPSEPERDTNRKIGTQATVELGDNN